MSTKYSMPHHFVVLVVDQAGNTKREDASMSRYADQPKVEKLLGRMSASR